MRSPSFAAGRWVLSLAATIAVVAAAFLGGPRDAAAAPILLGTIGGGSHEQGIPSTLVEIDPATGGLLRTIGGVGYTVNGLTYDPTSGILYGSTSWHDPSYNGLITIDLTTGVGTPIGVDGWGWGGITITCITTNSAGQMFGWSEDHDSLMSIATATGIATWVGESDLNTRAYGLSFDNSDVLWFVNEGFENPAYYTVDPTTGAAAWQGWLASLAHHGDFDPVSGMYYGIDNAWENPRNILAIDLSTGSIISTLPTVNNLHTLAFVNVPTTAIPEPTTLALAGLGALGMAMRARRRRRRT
ncbi:MAG TPA: PEP-CTERM sorting domain-containing protein [Planctomycetota bacterium]|nr:PEP-CTERM sorting domain-containing protein [Planctomycetota bacterium]